MTRPVATQRNSPADRIMLVVDDAIADVRAHEEHKDSLIAPAIYGLFRVLGTCTIEVIAAFERGRGLV